MNEENISQAVDRGLDFLARQQLPSGQFPVQVSFPLQKDSLSRPDETLFATTHIVYSLGFLPQPSAQTMISQALRYFQHEMTGQGLWRYWNKTAKYGRQKLAPFIPADLDDTAAVSYLMRRHGIPLPDNECPMLLNRNRAGLFYTWLMLRPQWTANLHYWRMMLAELTIPRCTIFFTRTEAEYRDVDAVVNANVLLYLGERAETQPVIAWLTEIVRNGTEADCDKWYRDSFTFYYAMSRNYHAGVHALGSVKGQILARLAAAEREDGQIGEYALHTALAANILLNLEVHGSLLERAIGFLLRAQREPGNWDTAPYYYSGPKKQNSWGSEELTTGICLEALHRFHA